MLPFTISFIIWAILHSITAAQRTKKWVRQQIGDPAYEGLYRLGYNIFAGITFIPVLYLLAIEVPTTVVWNITTPFDWLFWAIRLGGGIGLVAALWQTDIWDFAGLRQAMRYFRGDDSPISPARLVTDGMYGLVRHPLYLFSLLFIWFSPVMTFNGLIFNLFVTLYFWIGSTYEEKRLTAEFGSAYEAYKQQVPRLLPIALKKRI